MFVISDTKYVGRRFHSMEEARLASTTILNENPDFTVYGFLKTNPDLRIRGQCEPNFEIEPEILQVFVVRLINQKVAKAEL
jgi:hypothetical protein